MPSGLLPQCLITFMINVFSCFLLNCESPIFQLADVAFHCAYLSRARVPFIHTCWLLVDRNTDSWLSLLEDEHTNFLSSSSVQ